MSAIRYGQVFTLREQSEVSIRKYPAVQNKPHQHTTTTPVEFDKRQKHCSPSPLDLMGTLYMYYYARRDGEEDPDSPPRGVLQECFRYQIRQRPLRRSDKTTDTQSVRKGCAIAARVPAWWNLDLMNPYRDPHGSTIPAFSLLPLFSWYGCAGVGKCQTVTELPPTCRFELRKSGWC